MDILNEFLQWAVLIFLVLSIHNIYKATKELINIIIELITEDLHAFAEDQANLGLVKRTVCKHGTIVYGDSLGCVYCGRG